MAGGRLQGGRKGKIMISGVSLGMYGFRLLGVVQVQARGEEDD